MSAVGCDRNVSCLVTQELPFSIFHHNGDLFGILIVFLLWCHLHFVTSFAMNVLVYLITCIFCSMCLCTVDVSIFKCLLIDSIVRPEHHCKCPTFTNLIHVTLTAEIFMTLYEYVIYFMF